MKRKRLSALWRQSGFVALWSGQTVSVFGSMVTHFALPWTAVIVLGATPLQMSILAAAEQVAAFLVGLMAGVVVDRLRRRPVLIGADLGRALVLGTIPLAWWLHHLHIEQLYLVAFLGGVLTVFFDVAYLSYLPTLVRREQLVEANSRLSASASAAEFSAFSLSGFLVQLLTAPVAILIDALSFLVSAVSVALIRAPEPAPAPAAERSGIRREIAEGLRLVAGRPVLRAVAGVTLMLNLSRGLIGPIFLLYVGRELGFPPAVLGVIYSVGGLSSLAGSFLVAPLMRRRGLGPAMMLTLVLAGVALLFIPLAPGATLLGAACLVIQQLLEDSSETAYLIMQVSLCQALVEDRLQGRMNGSLRVVQVAAILAGTLTGGILGETVGLRPTLVLAALATMLSALWLLFSPVRGLVQVPALPAGAAPLPEQG